MTPRILDPEGADSDASFPTKQFQWWGRVAVKVRKAA